MAECQYWNVGGRGISYHKKQEKKPIKRCQGSFCKGLNLILPLREGDTCTFYRLFLLTSQVSIYFHWCDFPNGVYTDHSLYGEHWIFSTLENQWVGSWFWYFSIHYMICIKCTYSIMWRLSVCREWNNYAANKLLWALNIFIFQIMDGSVVTPTKSNSRIILTVSKWHMILKECGNIKKVQEKVYILWNSLGFSKIFNMAGKYKLKEDK